MPLIVVSFRVTVNVNLMLLSASIMLCTVLLTCSPPSSFALEKLAVIVPVAIVPVSPVLVVMNLPSLSSSTV